MVALGEPQLFECGLEREGPRPAEAGADDLDGHLLPPESGPIRQIGDLVDSRSGDAAFFQMPRKGHYRVLCEHQEGPVPDSRPLRLSSAKITIAPTWRLIRLDRLLLQCVSFLPFFPSFPFFRLPARDQQ